MSAPPAPPVDLTRGVYDDVPGDAGEAAPNRCQWAPCGKVIVGRNPQAKYCTDDHKDRAYRERRTGGTSSSSAPSRNAAPAKRADMPIGAAIWGGLGYVLQLRMGEPIGAPLGRVMQLQAGDAGPRLERIGHRVAKALPLPAVKMLKGGGELGRDIGALLLPPMVTVAIASGAIPATIAQPIFLTLMRPLIVQAIEQSKHDAGAIAELTDAEKELYEEAGQIIAQIFGGQMDDATPEPEGANPYAR